MTLNHFDIHGQAVMVDISSKQPSMRKAIARSCVQMHASTIKTVVDGRMGKGDVLGVARLAGISAAKKTPDLIPLAHPLSLHAVTIDFTWDTEAGIITIEATVKAFERTGVEMEAMVAASVAALAVYDMCKGHDKSICIKDTMLMFKEGGKSGVYQREASL